MEIKAQLKKPYSEKQKNDFVVKYNHQKGYEIKETDIALTAWGKDDGEKLQEAKAAKYNEALTKAKNYIDSGQAQYELALNDEIYHVEATDGNISKTGLKAIMLSQSEDSEAKDVWNTKEDINIYLDAEQFKELSLGLGAIQADVWTLKFPYYVETIENAQTLEEIDSIVIDYALDIPKAEIEEETEIEETKELEEEEK